MDIFSLPISSHSSKSGFNQRWSGLSGSTLGLAIANCARQSQGLTLVITENSQQAERLRNEIDFFAGNDDAQNIEKIEHSPASSNSLNSSNTDNKATEPQQKLNIFEFPDWETLPFDNFSAHQDIISQRLDTLYRLPQMKQGVLIVSVTTLMHRLPPASYIAANSLMLKVGQLLDIKQMRRKLEAAGYLCVESVFEHGEFAVRGSIMDIFPMGSKHPYRIELFDDDIESLRRFDPETQISSVKVDEIRLLPGKEFPLNQSGIEAFRKNFRSRFDVDVRHCPMYEDITQGLPSAGIEYYLPLFFTELTSLFDFLPSDALICTTGSLSFGADQFWREVTSRYDERCVDPQRPLLKPSEVFLPSNELFKELNQYNVLNLSFDETNAQSADYSLKTHTFPDLGINQKHENPLQSLQHFLQQHEGQPVLFCTDSAGRRETLLDLLKTIQIHPQVISNWMDFCEQRPSLAITVAPIDLGLWLEEPEMIVIAESQLFTHHVSQRRRRGKFTDNTDFIVKSLMELHTGAPVVHLDHGIGRYLGLQTFEVEEQKTEFLVLEYADQAKLYVPVSSLHLISRYGGSDPDSAPLHRLGNDQWQKAKKKAAEKIIDVAAQLLEVYARRAAQKGYCFELPKNDYQLFANSFPFEETEDQALAIKAVINDMTREQPMDRLVCGDVGFGKTEVALRAAFIAANNDKQVAILVPTTLLAQQHFESFKDRFADWPIEVALMSRFVSNAKQQETLAKLASGKVDIVIGTHKLLQPSMKYKNLGLLIIDEEHRFGVRQKEQIKAMRANVDILTLTATPIPRTLNMSMAGMRDLSIIASPPPRRLSIKTFVRQRNDSLIKEAILRELLRGGQVFFLHNEVKSIEKTAEELRALVPEARVCVGHGQLPERELERIMSEFYHKHYNILVCSTIIETGIDIPSANTIIIDRADKFGLAQLHQLRGRVGRSHHQAYAYLLTPHPKSMSKDAHKRVDAIMAADTLGAGFTLASHDLEIRGAGELLGDEQSGHIHTIGFSLYSEMLEQTVQLMKEGKDPDIDKPLKSGTEINLRIPALIPEEYLPDVHTRLLMYKRIASAKNNERLIELKIEMIDRFGLLPQPLTLLFEVTHMKLKAQLLGIDKIEANVKSGKIEFNAETKVDPLAIVNLVQNFPQTYSMKGATQLRFNHGYEDAIARIEFINDTLQTIKPK